MVILSHSVVFDNTVKNPSPFINILFICENIFTFIFSLSFLKDKKKTRKGKNNIEIQYQVDKEIIEII